MIKKPTFFRIAISVFRSVRQLNQPNSLLNGTLTKFKAVIHASYDLLSFQTLKKKQALSYSLFTIVFFISSIAFAQLAVPFTPRLDGGSIKVKGDVVFIGNSIVTGAGLTQPYNGTGNNNNREGVYINVASGGDPNIFSSSSAELVTDNSCKQIIYAGLYWSSVYPLEEANNSSEQFEGTPRLEDWNEIKFKLPTGGFIDLVADNNPDAVGEEDDIIFDGFEYYGAGVENSFKDSPIICYKNVTGLVQGLTDADGNYTVANLRATRGRRRGGCSAGWTLVIIYESPTLPSKYITLFDGYAGVQGGTELDIPVSGFQTLPAPYPVNANIGIGALEGDIGIGGDQLQFKASTNPNYTVISDAVNQANNFFNSSITRNGVHNLDRNPASTNTLGMDINNVVIPNPGNIVIPNDATAGDLKLVTRGDGYGAFVTSFSVEIIEPNILLTKIVEDDSGNNIGGQAIGLGTSLNYVIGFQNIGNDNAINFQIRDILPVNIIYNHPTDLVLPPGVTVASYNPVNRELIFDIDNALVEEFDPVYEIRIESQVVAECNQLADACSNIVNNQAFANYRSATNPSFLITDDPSLSGNTGCLLSPQATNFLTELDCQFTEDIILCGTNVDVTAADGYDAYSWSTSPTGTPIIGATQTINVTSAGTYYSFNNAVAPCQSIQQVFNVQLFGGAIANPVIAYADEVVTCPNDGKLLPNIFLCGADDSRLIQTNISDSISIIWELLDASSCAAVTDQDCANENAACTWNEISTGSNFLADTAGQYRLTINYPGGCFNQFHFNVYQNLLLPTVISSDIICTTLGSIIVNDVPSGYEYSLDGTNYQPSTIFTINTAGFYTVYMRQIGVPTNPCIFTVIDIQIRDRNFTASSTVVQPFCNGDLGSIYLAANDSDPQYFFSLYNGATLVNSVGPIIASDYTFANLNPGTYTATVATEDGCTYSEDITIIEPPILTVTAAITVPLSCLDGELTMYPQGGTPPYFYFVNSTTNFQTVPTVVVTAAGVYDITVVDANNCSASVSITVDANPPPEYTISQTDILCYNDNSGQIQFNILNANGYTLEFSIDNGLTFMSSTLFSNLFAGTYNTIVRYSLMGTDCLTTSEIITISQPDSGLTATAGISELVGCGPSGEGTIRITNPQGGTPFTAPNFYEYSFDNLATWTSNNEAYFTAGTYTVYLRDANGCIYAMEDVILDQEPPAPVIQIAPTAFNCDGSGSTTVTITNNGGPSFSYDYYIDGNLNPNTADPQTFLDVTTGPHTISVVYTLLNVPTFSNLLNETFGYGADTTSPGINTFYYCFEQQVVATQCKNSIRIQDGDYTVTADIIAPYGAWVEPLDHTSPTNPITPDGRFLVVNIGGSIPATEILYEKQINDIIPNQPIQVEFAAMNLLQIGNTQFNPDLRVALVDASGTEISFYNTGDIPKTGNWIEYPTSPITLDPGANTSLKFILRSNVQQTSGNDVAIDDLRVFQLPEACATLVDFPFIIPSGNAFATAITSVSNVTCSGAIDGEITIVAQNFNTTLGFQYSIDNGSTWVTQMTSPYTITGLTDGNYNIQIRYDDAPDTCLFAFSETISIPDPIAINLTNTPVTCLDLATITATATGGTANYAFKLIDTNTPFTETNFQSNGIITGVNTGTYTVEVTDAFGCTASEVITLDPPPVLNANIAIASDVCYDGTNGATLEVSVTSGQAPYQYNSNGGAFQSSNTFDNLVPGTYTIIVRDSYGCEVTLSPQTIEPQLVVNALLTKNLDCSASPDAILVGTISGGNAPYAYQISFNAAPYGASQTTGATFNYTTPNTGDYQFLITDAAGCAIESSILTVNPLSVPVLSLVSQNQSVLCNGDSNGSIDITIDSTSGIPPFTINVNNDTTGTNYGTQTSGLAAGTYTVTLTDSNSCTATDTVTIDQPDPIVVDFDAIDITCSAGGVSQGSVIINTVTGGTPPYNYFVTGTNGYSNSELNNAGTTSVSFDVVDFGLYQINVVDTNGCSLLVQNVLVASPPTDLDIDITTTVDCSTGGIAVVSIGSSLTSAGPFWFSIYQGPTSIYPLPAGTWIPEDAPGSESATFNNLTPGVLYTFIVYDASTNCSYYEPATTPIPTNSSLTATAVSASNITCTGSADGTVSFTVNSTYGNSVTVDYEIFDALSLNTTGVSGSGSIAANGSLTVTNLGPLPFGNYYVNIVETSGANANCGIVTLPFNITESAFLLELSTSLDQNANCNANSGELSAIGQNGTAPYQYQITTTPTAPLASDAAWASASVFNVDAGGYYVHVIDAYGCIISSPIVVVPLDASPVISAVVNNECTVTEGNYAIDVTLDTAGISPYSYSIDGGAFQTQTAPFTISNLVSGVHTIEIRDVNGCGNLVSVAIAAPIDATTAITTAPSCSDDDGIIEVTASGGTGTYTYSISPSPASITVLGTIFSGVPSGTYTITLTDSVTLCTTSNTITLEAATPVVFSLDSNNSTCSGSNDGVITVNLPASNDNPIYTYEIIAPILVGAQTAPIFTGLTAGVYTVQVNSGKGCTAIDTIEVFEPASITVDATSIAQYICNPSDNTLNFASISTTSVIGGSGTYINYEFIRDGIIVQFGSNTTYTESDLSGGTYVINVYDDKGCLGTTTNTLTIDPFTELDELTITIDNPITCNNLEDITVTTSSTGGPTPNLQYTIEDVVGAVVGSIYSETNTTGLFIGLDIGNYSVTVENIATGCILETVHYVNDPNTFDLIINSVIDVTCFNANDGSVTITLIDQVITPTDLDESGPFNYTIFDNLGNTAANGTTTNAGPLTINNLLSGVYTINATLINSPFCTASKSFTIIRSTTALSLSALETANVTCTNSSGTIIAIATGGWGNYEYELTGAASAAYSANGTFTNLSAGSYTINARDIEGCIVSEIVILEIPDPITATFAPNTNLLSCFGDQDGSITITTVTGGQGSNYSYTLNTILPTPSSSGPQTANIFTDLGPGTYSIIITDGFECDFTSLDIVIAQPDPIAASLVRTTTQTCLTESTLTLSATGGTGTFDYSNDPSFSNIIGSFNTSTTFTVSDGIYAYYVRDANGCNARVSNEITVDPLPELLINLEATNPYINCNGDNNGSILATAQGGLGNYNYTLQDGLGNTITATENTPGYFTALFAGDYIVVIESGDCSVTSAAITITQPLAPLDATIVVNDVTCSGNNDGFAEITATGGTGIIQYAISPQLNQFFETNTFENLVPGDYTIIVQDTLGCFLTFNFSIAEPEPVILTIVADSLFPEVCAGDANGEFSIDISGGNLPYNVSLDNYDGPYTTGGPTQTEFDFTNLGGGDHIVYIRDAQDCESEWNITFPDTVVINPEVTLAYVCDNNTQGNTVTVTVDDSNTNLSDLDYALDGGSYQESNMFTNVPVGSNHYIEVRHTNGCIQTTEFFDILGYTPITLTLTEGELNEFIANASGGSGNYTYTMDGEDYGDVYTYTITASGLYSVTVTDSAGCSAMAQVELEFVDICIPNWFTPNGDGTADTWAPGCTGSFPSLTFAIFDRYGRKVADYRVGEVWDGRYNGNELPSGDYWYVVKTNDPNVDREFVGHFTLYR
jgi:gliding motility-associated-like protein